MQTKIKYKMTNREKRENRWGILFSLPCILGFLIFALLPMVVSLGLSFTNFNFTTGGQFIGISNYKNLFSGSDPYFYKSLLVTVIYVALSVPTAIIFSFFIAMLLNTNVKGKGFFRTIFYLPTVVPIVAMAAIWMWIFNPDMGLANNILKAMHLPVSTWLSGESSVIPTLVFINLWTTGSTMVIFLAGMQDVPRQLLEAVEIDGGGFWAKLLHVTIPMMTPTIFYNVVMGIINGFQIFTQSYVMTQGGPNNSSLFYVYYLYREAFEFGRMGNACAVAWVLFLIIMVLTAVIFKFSNRFGPGYHGQQLKDLNDTISEFKKNRLGPVLNHLKKRKKALAEKRKKAKAAGIPYESVLQRENELKKYEKEIKQRYDEYVRENYTKPISYFRTLTKSMKFYEVLNNIQLIIHIQADDAVLHDLEQHWTDIKSIGRSEDMVDIQQAKVIDLVETGNVSATSEYSAYIDSEALKLDEETDERKVYPYKIRNRMKANGTRYYLNKNYELKDGKRIFEKKSVVYISQYGIDKIGNGIYLDQEDGKNYIVNFL